ncbi:hypothetical protein B0A52_02786 [Exophiala mesophila]|uniref:Uncharacterized protein n=1 Tax=Exophiala mesophila TaxID=212818 RepID=A0A438NDX7_EXOME|nr:hypothetical protein B0A52_02786 [Exophiala mesophila]
MHFLTWMFLCIASITIPSVQGRSWEAGDTCPSEIAVTIPNYSMVGQRDSTPQFQSMSDVHAALKTCANITSLDLRVTLLGCSGWPDRWNFPFSLTRNETYPSLQRLKLEGYDFVQRPWDETRLAKSPSLLRLAETVNWMTLGRAARYNEDLRVTESQRQMTNLDLWLQAMDWSRIQELSIECDRNFMNKTPSYLTGLKKLEIDGHDVQNTTRFIDSLVPDSLTHLSWTGPRDPRILSAVTAHQPKSLEYLDLHSFEVLGVPSLEFSEAQIRSGLAQLTNLSHLSINIPRNDSWPLETLSAISSCPSLTTLELWLDIASECRHQKPEEHYFGRPSVNDTCTGVKQYRQPYLNETTATEAMLYLRENKIGKQLTNVTFWTGDWSRPWDGPLYFPPWIEHRKAKVVCSVNEADRVTCVVEEGRDYWEGSRYGDDFWDRDEMHVYL